MIAIYSVFFALGAIAFFLLAKLGLGKRFLISFLIFALPSIIFTAALILNGDKPTEGARTVTPSELEREGD